MRRFLLAVPVIFFLSSCSQTTGGGQRATVELRDGTSVSGTVVSSSASEIQIAADDQTKRTIPMAQVRSVEYEEPAPAAPPASPAPAAAPAAPAASAPAAPAAGTPAPPAPGTPVPPKELRHREHYHPRETAITSKTLIVPEGTEVSVRNEETIDSSKAVEGQTFPAEVTKGVPDATGNLVIPAGANAQIVIRSSSKGGKIRGASDLVLDLASVSIDGRQYRLSTVDLEQKGRSGVGANKRTGIFTGGGAAVGAIIGAIAGGGKGAAIGAGSGAGAGALTQVLTKGTIKVPVETVLTFKLDQPLRVEAAQ
jgi:hypothetical protein